MGPIKVLFLRELAYPLFDGKVYKYHGGAEVQLYNIAMGLSENGFDVSFIVRADGPSVERKDKVTIYKLNGHPRFYILKRLFRYFYYILDFIDIFRYGSMSNADIFVTRAPAATMFELYFIARMFGKKFVYMVAHDAECEKRHPLIRRRFTRLTFHYTLGHADLVIAQTHVQKEKLRLLGIRNVVVIRNAQPPSNALHRKKKDYILWVARAEKWKQPEMLLDMASRLKRYRFVMICPGIVSSKETYKDYGADFYRRVRSTKNITFIDKVPHNQIDTYFREAKLFLNTSVYEGFPNTFIEAWKNATPVVSIRVDPDDVIERHRLGYRSGTVQNACRQIRRLMLNNNLYKQLSRNCYKFYQKNLRVERMVDANARSFKVLLHR